MDIFSDIQNLEGHQNCCIGSKVTAILLYGLILHTGGVASGRVCACSQACFRMYRNPYTSSQAYSLLSVLYPDPIGFPLIVHWITGPSNRLMELQPTWWRVDGTLIYFPEILCNQTQCSTKSLVTDLLGNEWYSSNISKHSNHNRINFRK